MDKENMEMSTVDKNLPRYYKGYDMDILMTKVLNYESMTSEEDEIVLEAQRIYYAIKFENNRKRMEETEKKYAHVHKGHPLVNIWCLNASKEGSYHE